jgi:uncharacterized membrane protein
VSKRKKEIKDLRLRGGVLLFALVFTILGARLCAYTPNETDSMEFFSVKITAIGESQMEEGPIGPSGEVVSNQATIFRAAFTSGAEKGQEITAVQFIDDLTPIQPRSLKVGDTVLVAQNAGAVEGADEWMYIDHKRSHYLIWLVALFLFLVVLIGRKKGLSTIFALLSTAAAIFMIYIPSILRGFDIYLMTSLISIYIIVVSLLLINAYDSKTLSAILGNIGGVAAAGGLALLMNRLLHVTGFVDEDYMLLLHLNKETPLDLQAVVWGAIVIGALGAIMDIAMTIASAMYEVAEHMPQRSFKKLFRSGMNVGVDSIGTMTNTLILAYVGSSLTMVLLMAAYHKDMLFLFNMEMIVVEVTTAIVGSLGILFAVPATAFISAYLYTRPSEWRGILRSDQENPQ